MPKPLRNQNLVRRHAFKKGDPRPPNTGRKKGTPNRTTRLLKDAILTAANMVGEDGKGKRGLVGYLMMLARKEKQVYARLLEKVLPLQVAVEDKTPNRMTAAEAVARLRERHIPVPPSLVALAGPESIAGVVAHALNDQHEDGITDDLDNRLRSAERDYDAELDGDGSEE